MIYVYVYYTYDHGSNDLNQPKKILFFLIKINISVSILYNY